MMDIEPHAFPPTFCRLSAISSGLTPMRESTIQEANFSIPIGQEPEERSVQALIMPSKNFWCLTFVCFFLLPLLPLAAWDCCDPFGLSVEVRADYFRPNSGRVRRAIGNGWADYQLEVSKRIFTDWRLTAASGGYVAKGSSNNHRNHTRLQFIPISLGFKYDFVQYNRVTVFAGVAATYGFLHFKEHTPYYKRHVKKNQWGGLIQTGVNYHFSECAYAGIFVDYVIQKFNFHHKKGTSGYDSNSSSDTFERSNLNLRGFKMGATLGLNF